MESARQTTDRLDDSRRSGHAPSQASYSASLSRHLRSNVDSWVEVSSQPSSSSLSSIGDDTALQAMHDLKTRRRPIARTTAASNLAITRDVSAGGTSSQEEYEESESEEDRVMTSSGEGMLPEMASPRHQHSITAGSQSRSARLSTTRSSHDYNDDDDDDDENRTAINYPIRGDASFTPQPNAFSHPPSAAGRHAASQPEPGSYFPPTRARSNSQHHHIRQSLPNQLERRHSHMPHNILSPSYNAAIEHEEALRASLTGLLSVAAAARSLPKTQIKGQNQPHNPPRSNRIDPISFRIIPESALPRPTPPTAPTEKEPTFQPTIRPSSTRTSSSSDRDPSSHEHKRKAVTATNTTSTSSRSSSRERRAMKKARRTAVSASAAGEDLSITPTLLTWVVSAGIVVIISALTFSAGYGLGREAGRIEATVGSGGVVDGGGYTIDEILGSGCAKEAGRSSLGLKRSLARSAIQA